MIVTVDDLCLSYLKNFIYFDEIKNRFSGLKLTAFAIANRNNEELLVESGIFKTWFDQHKDWVAIGVHSYDHQYPPDGDRENEKYWIEKALDSLKPFLPTDYSYRSPGWQTTIKTIPTLKDLGFRYMFYEGRVKDLKEERIVETQVFNSHLYDIKSMERLKEVITR